MIRVHLRYLRYALSAFSTVGFLMKD